VRELGLHILDIVENALAAGATQVALDIVEDIAADRLTIKVKDNGRGMDDETIRRVYDPFYTTRTTRHVGLGIPLFAATAKRCAGRLSITSRPGQGATVTAVLQHSHIDRPPLGDMPGTLICILMRDQDFDLTYTHRITGAAPRDASVFTFDTAEIKRELGPVPLTHPAVREWLLEFVTEGEQALQEAASQWLDDYTG